MQGYDIMEGGTSQPQVVVANGDMQGFLAQAISDLREKLIDISKRNPLISFKHSERSASYVRVVDERPDGLFVRLRDGEMQFEPLPDPEAEPAGRERLPTFAWRSRRLA